MTFTSPQSNSENSGLRAVSINENPQKTGRWIKLLKRQWPTLVPLSIALFGLALAIQINFRVGAITFSLAVGLATLLRLWLPRFSLGWLYVRTKWIDVVILGVFSVLLLVLSIVVPS